MIVPAAAMAQPAAPTMTPLPGAPAATATTAPAATMAPAATPVPAARIELSTSSGLPDAPIAITGSGFRNGETVNVTFSGAPAGTRVVNDSGAFTLAMTVPNDLAPGPYGLLAQGQSSKLEAIATFTINQPTAGLTFAPTQAAPGTSVTVTATGFRPGETVEFRYNGPVVGTAMADTKGQAAVTFVAPTLDPGAYDLTATGAEATVTVQYTVLAPSATPLPTAAPTTASPTPTPATVPSPAQNAPALAHDDRYFSQTGYRIENDQVWGFFQQYGGPSAFGYPVSRTMSFLGCPVQMFQRHIIQVCAGQGAGLINLLDPEIFPYTQVNGSTFPGPDPAIKNNTPQVGSPTYAEDVTAFIDRNVPNTYNGAQVNFLQTFNELGGLTIWGAPISAPAPEPTNPNFVYQRFQRGVMHFIAGSGTQSILLADYLKAIMMNQNVPGDLLQQSRETRFFNQYCPGQTLSLCRPSELPGTDLTYAFVAG